MLNLKPTVTSQKKSSNKNVFNQTVTVKSTNKTRKQKKKTPQMLLLVIVFCNKHLSSEK